MRVNVGVCLAAAFLGLACPSGALADQASKLYKEGRKAEREGAMAQAYLLYSQAAAIAPKNNTYWLRSQAVRTRAALQSKIVPPISATDPADELSEDEDLAEPVTGKDLREARKPLPPTELQATPGRKDFTLREFPKPRFEKQGRPS